MPCEISLTMSLVITNTAMKLGIFATHKPQMFKEPLFPSVHFPTFLTPVSSHWLYNFWHQHLALFILFHSKISITIWTITQIPRPSCSQIEDMFQWRNIHVCRENFVQLVLIDKFWEELRMHNCDLHVSNTANVKLKNNNI